MQRRPPVPSELGFFREARDVDPLVAQLLDYPCVFPLNSVLQRDPPLARGRVHVRPALDEVLDGLEGCEVAGFMQGRHPRVRRLFRLCPGLHQRLDRVEVSRATRDVQRAVPCCIHHLRIRARVQKKAQNACVPGGSGRVETRVAAVVRDVWARLVFDEELRDFVIGILNRPVERCIACWIHYIHLGAGRHEAFCHLNGGSPKEGSLAPDVARVDCLLPQGLPHLHEVAVSRGRVQRREVPLHG
mmetsp:Transcript_8230/g.18251  ORF Transcript_8230/g.18251 Transcript_8230/m.18251 type:complete len:244 (-) Transcript_8230:48-779(-)